MALAILLLATLLLSIAGTVDAEPWGRISPTFVMVAKLTAGDGVAGDRFGTVSVDGDTAVIGAVQDDDRGNDSGSAYVFVRSGETWLEQAKLTASDGSASDRFGIPSIDGNLVVIGAPGDDSGKGAAYVFGRSNGAWSEQRKLIASDGTAGDRFGASVSMNRDTILVGAPGVQGNTGAAYVFAWDGASWAERARLNATEGIPGDRFGTLSLSGDTAVIGAWGHAYQRGAVYVFVRNGTTWSRQAKLMASDAQVEDEFGSAVSLDNDTALIGAPDANGVGVNCCKGAVYVFHRTGTTWSEQARLTANDALTQDHFGTALAVGGDFAVIGSPGDDDLGLNAGSAYVFGRNGTSWTQQVELRGWDGEPLDSFGNALALHEAMAIIGAPNHDELGPDSGAVYVFDLARDPLDDTSPTVTIDSPGEGSTLAFPSVMVSGTASDDVGVERVEVSADGTLWVIAAGTTYWSGSVTLRDGSNTIFVQALDASGNVGTASIGVNVQLGSSGGLPSWTPFGVLAIVIAVVEATIGFLWGRRRDRIRPPSQ